MSKYIQIKSDNRYKNGNIKKVKGVYKGNSETISMKRLEVPQGLTEMYLNPPIIVGSELAKAIKKELGA